MDLIIKNGTIVTPLESYVADLAVKGGKIVAIGTGFSEEGASVVDAKGKLILPGAIDAHTHLAMPFGGTVSADSYLAGTRAAACGGVTTVFDYPMQRKGSGIIETIETRKEMCDPEACVDYAFHCIITDLNEESILDEFQDAVEYGVPSFKCFLVYKKEGMMVDDATLVKILLKAKETGAMTNIHAENPDLIDLNIENFLKEGKTSAWYHYLSRPEFVEAEADKRAVHLAKSIGAPLYLVHMADKEGLETAIEAKREGHDIYIETCPQYLEFTCDVYKREDGRNFVCSPPMKGQESQDALWKAIKSGDIDTVATDHCPFQSYEKDWGKDDFTKIPNGCAGVENLYPYMLSAANEGKITFNRAVELCSFNPAKIFGCTEKGSLTVGKDADIVIYDPNKDFTISVENMHSDYDHTIWEGKTLHGYPVQTYVRGNLVYDNGEFVGKAGFGQFVKRVGRK
ncbi:dihydropyrimidinase [Clostridium beijerinckii]|uniref:Dihydropyrimidinase n=1 Tax=Clostridium beijerinckii TaxID=1520 RepID=A0A1S9N117_CLOBE|nr:dihydropyrimidinase [Clostridium beijerinckii]MZK49794.1 dihydropyrimidinase [Clostridium beijerinckii]MZK57754.1 dihydropyrimidinase [Clostridium beijerinckii]MZK67839.1 dihydropyrimidinase [Clostridium beijerinckii]MZK73462.1 dihydropyrimidinase [Clostridium beijerinckii]MZK83045.1 dihydropyrimidinase [Clostridium beijerinckii]